MLNGVLYKSTRVLPLPEQHLESMRDAVSPTFREVRGEVRVVDFRPQSRASRLEANNYATEKDWSLASSGVYCGVEF